MKADILLTGATGYIGGRLLRHFEEAGRAVRCVARKPEQLAQERPTTEVVAGDCLDEASLDRAFVGVHSAYYLVHSMAAGSQFAELDRRAAGNFGRAAARAGVRRIIYLGGLADDIGAPSAHLQSRAETGDALRAGGVPVIEFRASIVIGAGSLSFEMIRALVERLPVMVCPRWVNTLTQPIAIDDVVAYLASALDLPERRGDVFEIGGPEVVSYGDIMREYARLRGLRRLLLPVPVLTPHLSGLWLALVTPAQAQVGRALVEGLKNATVVRSPAARETFTIDPMPLRAALQKAIDAGGATWKVDTREVIVDVPASQAFAPVRRIGGANGWYFGNRMWKMRGWLDRWFGGVSMNRGRRDQECCIVGDVIDGWTVVAYEPDRLMRLAADMKLPGRGWLEFAVMPVEGGRSRIRQTATFDPRGLLGRLYWNAVLPIHALMFGGLLRQIAQRAETAGPTAGRRSGPASPHRHAGAPPSTRARQFFRRVQDSGMTSRLRIVSLSLWTASALATTALVQGAPGGATARGSSLTEPVRTVDAVDLNRYVGEWFEVARFPNRFQNRCVSDVRARYTQRPDGRLEVINRCRTEDGSITEAHGVARVTDDPTFAKLKVRFAPSVLSFLPFVWGDYWILGLASDYSWATVGSPDRNYLWILARTPSLQAERFASALAAARANGFDVERLTKTIHNGADTGDTR